MFALGTSKYYERYWKTKQKKQLLNLILLLLNARIQQYDVVHEQQATN